jgi:hypothetical protein
MFKFKQVKVKQEEPKVVEKIVVIGNSVRTLYYSTSRNVGRKRTASYYGGLYEATAKEKEYNEKYWNDPRMPFELGGKDVVVTQVQGVLADDGKAYLLDVNCVIKVEE